MRRRAVKLLLTRLLLKPKYPQTYLLRFATSITGDKKLVDLNEDTLTGRFLIYFNDSKKSSELKCDGVDVIEKIKDNRYDLSELNCHVLINLIVLTTKSNNVKNKFDFIRVFGALDLELCKRLPNLQPHEVFEVLNAYMIVISNRITEHQFYQLAIEQLSSNVEHLPKSELVKFMFYVALQKKQKAAQSSLRRCLKCFGKEMINELTKEELCVICNSTFKTSTKIGNKLLLDKIRNYLNDNLAILKDPALFITLIKTIRHNKYQDDNLLNTIVCTIFFNKTLQFYSFTAMCHILALFADYLYYDANLLEHFTSKCLMELRDFDLNKGHAHVSGFIRDKDLKRFLWSLSSLGYDNLDVGVLKDLIVPKIVKRLEEGGLRDDPGSVVEMMLYLWMLGYQAVELVPYAFSPKSIAIISDSKTKAKERLNLLLTVIYFENRPLFRELNLKPLGHSNLRKDPHLTRRPVLGRVFENLKEIGPQVGLKFDANYQIPYLNVLGITGYKKNIYKAVNIEVLDDYVCVKNEECREGGLLKLKLRILDGLEEGLILIREDEVESLSDVELQKLLLDEIQLVC